MSDIASDEIEDLPSIEQAVLTGMELLRTIHERTATLLEGQYRQRELIREVIDGLELGDPQVRSTRRNELQDDGLQWLEDWLSEHDRRFDCVDSQLESSGHQFDLVHSKLDVILDRLQGRS